VLGPIARVGSRPIGGEFGSSKKALAQEAEPLSVLTAEETKVLDRAMHKLSAALS